MAQTNTTAGRSADLKDSPMMSHLIDALEQGTDIGHYGRLTFVMVARYFMSRDEMIKLLSKEPTFSEDEAEELIAEVEGHDYNPPKRNTILDWQAQQDFPICPNADDPDACNPYEELRFPDEVYDRIGHYWEQKAEARNS